MTADIARQIAQIRDERMILCDRLQQMQPKSWVQDACGNDIPVWTAAQQDEIDKTRNKLQQLAEAARALSRL